MSVEFSVSEASILSLFYGLFLIWISVGVSVVAIPIVVGALFPSPRTLWRIPVVGILGVNSMIVVVFVGQMITDGSFAEIPRMAYVLLLVVAITLVCAGIAFALYAGSYWLRSAIRHEPATALAT